MNPTLALATLVSLLAVPSLASAQSCDALLTDLTNHAASDTRDWSRYIEFTMVGNRQSVDWAEHTVGWLDYEAGGSDGPYMSMDHLVGEGVQHFSDRVFYDWSGAYPFAPQYTDDLGVSFVVDPIAFDAFGDLTLTWRTWGWATATVETECRGNYLYVFLGADEMMVFTFAKRSFFVIN